MKKISAILLLVVAVLAVCLVGCKGNEVDPGTATGDVSGDMIALATSAALQVNAPFQDYITAEMASNFVGLTEEEYTANVEEGVFFESMMSPANQSYCLLKVKEGTDVEALKQKVFDNANPRKWICMSADRVLVMADSEYVMLAMGPVATLDTLKAEFAKLAGGDVTEALDKVVNEGEDIPSDMPGQDDLYIEEEAETIEGEEVSGDVVEEVSGDTTEEVPAA